MSAAEKTALPALLMLMALAAPPALAQVAPVIPGPADITRIRPEAPLTTPPSSVPIEAAPTPAPAEAAPPGAEEVPITIRHLEVQGMTRFTPAEMEPYYREYLDRPATLDALWKISAAITRHYRDRGYFLSRAYVPAQEIEDGRVTIRVVEGFIGTVAVPERYRDNRVMVELTRQLTAERPLSYQRLESILLRLNDLPGLGFRSVLDAWPEGGEGASQLTLEPVRRAPTGQLLVNNHGSRFVGPYQGVASYRHSLIDNHDTEVVLSTASNPRELKFGFVRHTVTLAPAFQLEMGGSHILSSPGASLTANDIDSQATELDVRLLYHLLRQRDYNLTLFAGLDGRNTNTDMLGNTAPLTRERIRALRIGVEFDAADPFGGYHLGEFRISRGLDALGASQENELYLSRMEASPTFSKAEINLTRIQALSPEWALLTGFAGQAGSGALYSAEEFGYGGQRFGRAYDPSEITGDHGVAVSIETRYMGLEPWHDIAITPFVFYDLGKTWNRDTGVKDDAAASAGFGVDINGPHNVSASFNVAWPLTRNIGEPLYGDADDPRLSFQLGWRF